MSEAGEIDGGDIQELAAGWLRSNFGTAGKAYQIVNADAFRKA